MRIVLDTNVLVRVVTSPAGPAAELFELLRQHHRIVLSEVIGEELAEVLLRDRIKRRHQLEVAQVREFVESIMAGASVAAGAVVRDAVIISGATISAGAVVEGSIVGPDAIVGERAMVTGMSIVGDGVVVEAGASLDGVRLPEGD